jgi:tetratricopeptide (TPR) repeat protein
MRMNKDETKRGRVTWVLMLMAGTLSSSLVAQDADFQLMNAIPDDMFVVTASRPHPQRQFLDDYWGQVWQAFEDSGTTGEVLELVLSFTDDEHRSKFNRIRKHFTGLAGNVQWSELGSKEVAFGERLAQPVRLDTVAGVMKVGGHSVVDEGVKYGVAVTGTVVPGEQVTNAGSVWIGPPDVVLLFRSDEDVARGGFDGLVEIFRATFAEIDRLAGTEFAFEELEVDGTSWVSLDLLQFDHGGPQMPISIGLHGDVVIATFGKQIREDVSGLLSGKGSKRSIADSPRFKAAFAALPPANDAIEFFDMQSLKGSLEIYVQTAVQGIGRDLAKRPNDDVVNSGQDFEANNLNRFALEAYGRGDSEKALQLAEAAHEANPRDSLVLYNLACFSSLVGQHEEALDWLEQAVEGGFHAPNKILGDSDLVALRDTDRFRATVEMAKSKARAEPQSWLNAAQTLIDRFLDSLAIIDYGATVYTTDGHATYSDSITVLVEGARDNPFYPVISATRPIQSFARHLPKETTSYSVSGASDLQPLYTYLEQSLAEVGPLGEKLLQDWEQLQTEWDLDVQKDVLGLLGGEVVTATFKLGSHQEWIWMAEVENQELATELLASALVILPIELGKMARENPMMSMAMLRSTPSRNKNLPGFHEVTFGMSPQASMFGVSEGWLVLGSSAEAVLLVQATAAGEHPNVLENESVVKAALFPKGSVARMTFADHSNDAVAAGTAIRTMSAVGGMMGAAIPDPEARTVLARIIGIIAGLAPVVESINFFDSTSSHMTFDGSVWLERSVTHYVDPETR